MAENVSLRVLSKRGGTLAINLPAPWMRELEWNEKDTVALIREDNEIRICRVKYITLASGKKIQVINNEG